MEQVRLETIGASVSPLGLGCTGMSDFSGPADRQESIAKIHAAMDPGITLIAIAAKWPVCGITVQRRISV